MISYQTPDVVGLIRESTLQHLGFMRKSYGKPNPDVTVFFEVSPRRRALSV